MKRLGAVTAGDDASSPSAAPAHSNPRQDMVSSARWNVDPRDIAAPSVRGTCRYWDHHYAVLPDGDRQQGQVLNAFSENP